MRQRAKIDPTPTTAKAVGLAVLIVGGFWAGFGALMAAVIQEREQTPIAQQLAPNDPTRRVAVNTNRIPATLDYQRITLVPHGTPVTLDANKLERLGQTTEGFELWTATNTTGNKARGGGGGGRLAPRGLPQATGPVYVRTSDGKYQQMIQR